MEVMIHFAPPEITIVWVGGLSTLLSCLLLFRADFKIGVGYTYKEGGIKYPFEDSVSEYYTTIWGKLGLCADIPLGSHFYLRPMFLYGIGTVPKYYKDQMDIANAVTKQFSIINHGLDVKLALGYKF